MHKINRPFAGLLLLATGCGGPTDTTSAPPDNGTDTNTEPTSPTGTDTGSTRPTDSTDSTDTGIALSAPTVSFLGPHHVGFFSSVAFAPDGTVWASGDDGSGLYTSDDGGEVWSAVPGVPPDHSTYALVFDPTRPGTVYAPNHFGRGMLRSTDDGASWEVFTQGLPDAVDLSRRVEDLLVTAGGRLLLATRSGLFVSDDAGETWSAEDDPALATGSDLRALATDGSTIVAGAANGRLFFSADGEAWAELTDADGPPITDLALTPASVYWAYADGATFRLDLAAGTIVSVNDPSAGDPASVLWARLAVDPGADPLDPADDALWLGLVPADRTGQLLFSDDGGQTLTPRTTGLDGAPLFALAVDPANADHVVVGTVAEGLFVTNNRGQSWARGTGELYASAVLGFAEDPTDPDHLLVSVTEGLSASRGVYETDDGGVTWQPDDAVPVDVRALHVVGEATLAAGFDGAGGIYRRAAGATTWDQPLAAVEIERFVDGPAGEVWAVGPAGVWRSQDDGAAWDQVDPTPTQDLVFDADGHPVLCGDVVGASVDGFASAPAPLGNFPGLIVVSCTFVDDDTLLVGTGFGSLYRTDSYAADGLGVTWTEVSTPVADASMRSVVVAEGGAWYVSAIAPDVYFTPASTQGLWRSVDEGASWESLNDQLHPGNLVWEVVAGRHRDELFVPMWGGGGLRVVRAP